MKTLKIKVISVLALILVQEAIKMRMNLVLEMIIMRVFGLIQPSALLRDALNTILPRKERDVSDKGNSFIQFVPIVLFNSIVLIQFVLFNSIVLIQFVLFNTLVHAWFDFHLTCIDC